MDDWEDDGGCECEQDWNCGRHGTEYTWIETRYQGLDEEEARAHGAHWDY